MDAALMSLERRGCGIHAVDAEARLTADDRVMHYCCV